MKRFHFKFYEIALLVLGVFLLLTSSIFYIADVPLRQYLLGLQSEESVERVGILGRAQGGIRRKGSTGASFESVSQNAALYNQDTIVTGPDAGAVITLDDGGTIELGPNTMVKLQFERRLSLAGISRAGSVDVVAGRVVGSAVVLKSGDRTLGDQADVKLPSPTEMARLALRTSSLSTQKVAPVPTSIPRVVVPEVKILAPTEGGNYMVDKGSKIPEKKITLAWKVSPPEAELKVMLVRRAKNGPETVITETVRAEKGKASLVAVLKLPGEYEWTLSTLDPKIGFTADSKFRSNFRIDTSVQSIETLDPLVGGSTIKSNELKNRLLKDFDITLRWKPLPQVTSYIARIYKGPDDRKPILERTVRKPEYVLNKNKVYAGTMYYQIDAPMKSGFVATSGRVQFGFEFLPPIPVLPTDNRTLSGDDLQNENNKILFTWQKTNFTDKYVLEIAKDPAFKTIKIREEVKENFLVIDTPGPGRYWWRVSSKSGRLRSEPSAARKLVLGDSQAGFAPRRAPIPKPQAR